MTVGELMIPFMKLSNNMHAETLVKTMSAEAGGGGTWPSGLAIVTEYARTVGVDVATIRLSDGSGLSRKVNVTPDSIGDLLLGVQQEPWYQQWYASLPIAGNPGRLVGGTLRNRMRNTPAANNVHAKTGSLTGVTALSGYVTDADGRKLIFSMISNNYLVTPRPVEDAVAVTLASWSARTTAKAVKPSTNRVARADDCGDWVKAC
jgi:D-alanyl-D-alanine carboxypeptidase/D-alanyl-D-alanine-endopeptidase (penicillin-binding protein 4)